MLPQRLAPNLVDHFYRGGSGIAALRGIATTSDHQPEEWVGSTVARAGEWPVGLASTVGGDVLRDLVVRDPRGWVGADVPDGDTGLLLKLLDAGQRLPVHVHPDRAFAASHLDCPYGKTEAWLVLDAEPGAAVHLGWSQDVDTAELARRRDAQDGDWMLERMHRVAVHPGDGFLVPAGTVHAIGAGVLMAEVQEPTDLSILLEWSVTTSGREDSHLGFGFDAVMPVVSTAGVPAEALDTLRARTDLAGRHDVVASCLPADADPFFRLGLVAPRTRPVEVGAGFAVVVVLAGDGVLASTQGEVAVGPGATLAVPAGFGAWTVRGDVSLLVAQPGVGWPADLVGR